MFTEHRPSEQELATSPEMWARNFQHSSVYDMRTWLSIRLDQRWRLVREHIPRGKVLDVGCGFGEWVVHLSRAGYESAGLDYSDELIARLSDAYPALGWTCGSSQDMPFEANHFDGIISWGVIEHDPAGPQAQLREFLRVLKPGARTIVTVPNDSTAMRVASGLQFPQVQGGKFFQRFYTPDELAGELRQVGFRVIAADHLREVSPALVFPHLYARTNGSHPFYRAARYGCRAVPFLRGKNSMIYAVGERP